MSLNAYSNVDGDFDNSVSDDTIFLSCSKPETALAASYSAFNSISSCNCFILSSSSSSCLRRFNCADLALISSLRFLFSSICCCSSSSNNCLCICHLFSSNSFFLSMACILCTSSSSLTFALIDDDLLLDDVRDTVIKDLAPFSETLSSGFISIFSMADSQSIMSQLNLIVPCVSLHLLRSLLYASHIHKINKTSLHRF